MQSNVCCSDSDNIDSRQRCVMYILRTLCSSKEVVSEF